MRTQWPHSKLDERDERRESGHVGEQRMRTRYLPAERHETLPAQGETTVTLSLKLLRC